MAHISRLENLYGAEFSVTPMGNTSSSPATKLKRDTSYISRPRVLGSLPSPRPRVRALGPEYIISPHEGESPQEPSFSNHHDSKSHLASASTRTLSHKRSQTFTASQASLLSTEGVRRSRSVNTTGPTRADRASVFLGAPPPYAAEDPSSSNSHLPYVNGGFLDVPGNSYPAKGHRRVASNEVWNHQREFRGEYESSDNDHGLPEEFGYGIGNGMRPISVVDTTRMTMPLPPSPSSVASFSQSEVISSPSTSLSSAYNAEDPLELLKQYKTIFIVDDSASMAGERWAEAREALASLADLAAKYDTDGIDAYFLNANRTAQNMRSALSVKRQFDTIEPQGISLLARKLEELLHEYISELERAQREILRGDINALRRIKPMNYIILTDGVPTDDPEPVIIQAARRLDRGNLPVSQVGIQFVQVGDDPRATEALRELDDEIAKEYGIRDMVDSTPYSGDPLDSELLVKILLGGINRRVDKRGARSVLP